LKKSHISLAKEPNLIFVKEPYTALLEEAEKAW